MKMHLDRSPFDETFSDLEYIERMPLNDECLACIKRESTFWHV